MQYSHCHNQPMIGCRQFSAHPIARVQLGNASTQLTNLEICRVYRMFRRKNSDVQCFHSCFKGNKPGTSCRKICVPCQMVDQNDKRQEWFSRMSFPMARGGVVQTRSALIRLLHDNDGRVPGRFRFCSSTRHEQY